MKIDECRIRLKMQEHKFPLQFPREVCYNRKT